ncbi:hypothetical protein [Nocardioides litoris]|uniref:hypothetical protein n=1 Tax=Nocardioides litoris TaxID=1926648 RepID=UPI00111D982F|nr:hypothetical protein [Nocardioides litoris]
MNNIRESSYSTGASSFAGGTVNSEGDAGGIKKQLLESDPNLLDPIISGMEDAQAMGEHVASSLASIHNRLANAWRGGESKAALSTVEGLRKNGEAMYDEAGRVHGPLSAFKQSWVEVKNSAHNIDDSSFLEGAAKGAPFGPVAAVGVGAVTTMNNTSDEDARAYLQKIVDNYRDAVHMMPNQSSTHLVNDGSQEHWNNQGFGGTGGGNGSTPTGLGGGPSFNGTGGPSIGSPSLPSQPPPTQPPPPPGLPSEAPPELPGLPGGPGDYPGSPGYPGYPGSPGVGPADGIRLDNGSQLAGIGPGGGPGAPGLGAGPGGGLGSAGGLSGGAGGGGLVGGMPGAGGSGSGSPTGGAGGAAGGAAGARGGMPGMMPMHGNQNEEQENERSTWLSEDEDVWGGDDLPPSLT